MSGEVLRPQNITPVDKALSDAQLVKTQLAVRMARRAAEMAISFSIGDDKAAESAGQQALEEYAKIGSIEEAYQTLAETLRKIGVDHISMGDSVDKPLARLKVIALETEAGLTGLLEGAKAGNRLAEGSLAQILPQLPEIVEAVEVTVPMANDYFDRLANKRMSEEIFERIKKLETRLNEGGATRFMSRHTEIARVLVNFDEQGRLLTFQEAFKILYAEDLKSGKRESQCGPGFIRACAGVIYAIGHPEKVSRTSPLQVLLKEINKKPFYSQLTPEQRAEAVFQRALPAGLPSEMSRLEKPEAKEDLKSSKYRFREISDQEVTKVERSMREIILREIRKNLGLKRIGRGGNVQERGRQIMDALQLQNSDGAFKWTTLEAVFQEVYGHDIEKGKISSCILRRSFNMSAALVLWRVYLAKKEGNADSWPKLKKNIEQLETRDSPYAGTAPEQFLDLALRKVLPERVEEEEIAEEELKKKFS